jgi:hypothetical protein
MRTRIVILALSLLAAGCTASPGPEPSGSAPTTAAPTSAAPEPTPSAMPGGCGTTTIGLGDLPSWASSAGVSGPSLSVRSHEGNLVGVIFGAPLTAPPRENGPSNKILWIVREPRNGSDLVLTLRKQTGSDPITVREGSNSGPGEIYPSIVDVPAPGCWGVVAEWDGRRATLELNYQPRQA